MNRKQLAISLIVLALSGLMIYMLLKEDSSSWNNRQYSATGEKLFGDIDINNIMSFTVSAGRQTVTLKKNEDGAWSVSEKDSYPGDYQKILNFLKGLLEIKTVQNINAGKSQFEKLGLSDSDKEKGNSILLEFFGDSSRKVASLLIGKKHFKKEESPMPFMGGEMPDGCYVMLNDGKSQPKLVNNSFDTVIPEPLAWTDKLFFEVNGISSLESIRKNPDETWKLIKDEKGGKLALADLKEDEQMDEGKVQVLANFMKHASFKDVKPCPADFAGETFKIDTADGFKYEVCFSPKPDDPDKYLVNVKVSAAIAEHREPGKDEKTEDKDKLDKEFKARAENLKEKLDREKSLSKWLYAISKNDLSSVLKARKDFLKPKEEKKATESPASVPEVRPIEEAPIK